MSSYTQMHKKGGGSTSSTCSMDSLAGVKASEGSSKQMTGIRAHEPQREPLRQTENVLRTQNNAIRTENSVNKVCISKILILSPLLQLCNTKSKYANCEFKQPY